MCEHHNYLNGEGCREFILGGNAVFTVNDTSLRVRHTYWIRQSGNRPDLYFVYLLKGPDNVTDYTYIGTYSDWRGFCLTRASKLPEKSNPVKIIKTLLDAGNELPLYLEVWHEGRCGKCGRRLTTPWSIERGFGPECWRRTQNA